VSAVHIVSGGYIDFGLDTINADGTGRTTVESGHTDWVLGDWLPDDAGLAINYLDHCADQDGEIFWPGGTTTTGGPPCYDTVNDRYPSWSPDAHRLAFIRDGSIQTIKRDGSDLRALTASGYNTPSWSPDGTKIAYARGALIEVMNPDGSGATVIANVGFIGTFLPLGPQSWQPIPITGYPRPKGAGPLAASLVPAYQQCTNPNSSHGAPLSYPSCGARTESPNLTIGTPDNNGAAANFIGSVRLRVRADKPATPADEADVLINASATDIRCTLTVDPAACGSPNAAYANDYIGDLQARVALRITDRNNTPNPGGPGPGTVSDTPFSFTIPCAGTTTDHAIGGDCATATSADALVPGIVTGGQRSNWELGPVQVYDGGPDGVASTAADNTLFLTQGIFVP
jgi:hypothetical protein